MLDNPKKREEYIFFDEDNQDQIEDRIEEILNYIIGYNPMTLVGKVIQVRLSCDDWSNLEEEIRFESCDIRMLSFIPKTILRETPDDCSRFEIIPQEEIYLSGWLKKEGQEINKEVQVRILSVYSDYVSWSDGKINLEWTIQTECNDVIFELNNCRVKQIG